MDTKKFPKKKLSQEPFPIEYGPSSSVSGYVSVSGYGVRGNTPLVENPSSSGEEIPQEESDARDIPRVQHHQAGVRDVVTFDFFAGRLPYSSDFTARVMSSVGGPTMVVHALHLIAMDAGFRFSCSRLCEDRSQRCSSLMYIKTGEEKSRAIINFRIDGDRVHIYSWLTRTSNKLYHLSAGYVSNFLSAVLNTCRLHNMNDNNESDIYLRKFRSRVTNALMYSLLYQPLPTYLLDLPNEVLSIIVSLLPGCRSRIAVCVHVHEVARK